jgi:hypothetical protein
MELTEQEAPRIANFHKVVLIDHEGSFWEWDEDTERYHICGVNGQKIEDKVAAPGCTRWQIERLYGKTELCEPNAALQASITGLQQSLRNAYIID